MNSKLCAGCMLAFLGLAAAPAAHAQVFVPIDPTTTYLHTYQDNGGDSSPILLSSLVFSGHALQPGDIVNLSEVGDFLLTTSNPGLGFEDTALGVFSSSSTLLDASLLNRVPGAIKAGNDNITDPTLFGNEQTDIPEDFLIEPGAGANVTIPVGANYLFLSANDNLFGDNANPNNDFGVEISYVPSAPVPEASTTISLGLLLVFGMGGLAVSIRRRKASSVS